MRIAEIFRSRNVARWTARGGAWCVATGVLPMVLSMTARGAEPSPTEIAQVLVRRYASAIVSVSMVVKVSGMVGDRALPAREVKHEALATLIRPGGLAIVSLAAIDPSEVLDGLKIRTPKGPMKVEMTGAEFKLVRLRLADGTEVPARVVLKDPDLDIAFVKPIGAVAAPQVFVDLTNDATPQLLATGYILGRTGRATQSAPMIRRADIISLSEKPRRRIVPESGQPGCPMFDATGKVYGICVRQFANGRPAGPLVLPAAELAESAKQAEAMKAEPEEPVIDATPTDAKPAAPEPES